MIKSFTHKGLERFFLTSHNLLKGDMGGYCSVTVQANWRVIFQFAGDEVQAVDYPDYH